MNAQGFRANRKADGNPGGLPSPLSLTLPKDAPWFSVARLAAAAVGLNAGLSFEAIEDVKIIVTEACTYCVQRGATGGQLLISFETRDGMFIVTVRDREFLARRRPVKASGTGSPGEVDGLFIIRGLAEDVEYRTSAADGLTLRVSKAIQ